MGSPLSYAAGGAGDALEDILKQKFLEQIQRQQMADAQRRLSMEEARLGDERSYRQSLLQDRDEARAAATKANARSGADRLADDLSIGQELTPESVSALEAGDRGNLVKGATLSSTNISGTPARLKMTPNPGKGPTYTGTAGQLRQRHVDEESAQAREQARQDRIAAEQRAREEREEARRQAQQGREELIRLTASLRPQTASEAKAAGAAEAAAREQNEVEDSLALIKQIREDKALPTTTGSVQGRGLGYLQDFGGVTRVRALHDNLVSKLQLAQAGKLKGQGPISNSERELLKNAATALQLKLDDPDYLNELTKVEQQFQRMLTGPRVVNAPGKAAPNADPLGLFKK